MPTQQSDDVRVLRSQLRDLVALLALPAMWRGRNQDPSQIAASLADLLVHLMRLDLAYVRLQDPAIGVDVEAIRPANLTATPELAARVRGAWESTQSRTLPHPDGGTLRLTRGLPGIDADCWLVVAGSRREDFPTEAERFVLRVAVEQAAFAIESLRLYWEARRASQAKSEFLATMSHELRTPLNAIIGYADLLDAQIAGPLTEGQRGQLERIEAGARHLLQIIDEILTFSRIEAGREEVRVERTDLAELARDTCRLMEPLAEQKNLELSCHAPSRLEIDTDAGKVRQILLNLVSNAVKFTERGAVRLDVDRADGEVVLRVSDTGIGIDPEHLTRIFEPFLQIEQTPSRRMGGTGLGLSVTRQLARLLRGDVSVDSTPGEGSTFTIRLPVATGGEAGQGVD